MSHLPTPPRAARTAKIASQEPAPRRQTSEEASTPRPSSSSERHEDTTSYRISIDEMTPNSNDQSLLRKRSDMGESPVRRATPTPNHNNHAPIDTDNESEPKESRFSCTASNANQERRMEQLFITKSSFVSLSENMSASQAQQLAAAQAGRLQGMREVENAYQLEVSKIGRKTISFLDLPAEVRNTVYDFALVFPNSECDFHVRLSRSASEKTEISILGDFRPVVNILATCKQVHREASAMFYAGNHFLSDSVQGLGREWSYFTESIGRNINLIQHLNLHYVPDYCHKSSLSSLRRTLECFGVVTSLKRVTMYFQLPDVDTHPKDVSREDIPRLLVNACKGFTRAQYKARVAEALMPDNVLQESRNAALSLTATRNLLKRKQALATLDVVHIQVLKPPEWYSDADVELYDRDTFIHMCSVYDQLAKAIGLIGKGETLEGTDAFDWRLQQ